MINPLLEILFWAVQALAAYTFVRDVQISDQFTSHDIKENTGLFKNKDGSPNLKKGIAVWLVILAAPVVLKYVFPEIGNGFMLIPAVWAPIRFFNNRGMVKRMRRTRAEQNAVLDRIAPLSDPYEALEKIGLANVTFNFSTGLAYHVKFEWISVPFSGIALPSINIWP